jgi:DNA-binding MarR family transcriptional regulator
MSSEENVPADEGRDVAAEAADHGASAGERPRGPAPRDPQAPRYQVNDPAVMRALAHPLRWALLEALEHAGTLTATQAGDILGETPANCAFHLRTLAKYGLVEEAGGGKGRERPWRRAISGLDLTTAHEDPKTAAAAEVLAEFVVSEELDRARRALLARPALPDDLQNDLGSSQNLRYVTPAEAKQLQADLSAVLDRFRERSDDPALRPPGALPIEWLMLSYPVRDLLGRPAPAPDAESD